MSYNFKDKEVTETREVLVGATCDNCGAELKSVFKTENEAGGNFIGMLRVSVSGGYGEYVDGSGSCILCEECATILEKIPILKKAFEEASMD